MFDRSAPARLNERGRWFHPDLPGKDFLDLMDCEAALAKQNGEVRAAEEELWALDEPGEGRPRLKHRADALLKRQADRSRKDEITKLVGSRMAQWTWWIDNPRNAHLVADRIGEYMEQTGRMHWNVDIDLARAVDELVAGGDLPVGPGYTRLTPPDGGLSMEELRCRAMGIDP